LTDREGSLYGHERENPKLENIVTFESETQAREAARELKEMFREADSRGRRREIKMGLVNAANMGKNPSSRFDSDTREKWKKIGEVYRGAYEGMDLDTGTIHRKPMSEIKESYSGTSAGKAALKVHAHRRGAAWWTSVQYSGAAIPEMVGAAGFSIFTLIYAEKLLTVSGEKRFQNLGTTGG
jgi:hypothetical protein